MASKTFTISIDAAVNSASPGTNYNSSWLWVGRSISGDGPYRSLLKFNLDWTDVASITSAQLHYRTSATAGWFFGSSGKFNAKRITSTWAETTVDWTGQPTTTATGQVLSPLNADNGVWKSMDLTTIVRAWAPASVSGGGAQTNYGIMLVSDDESTYLHGQTVDSRSTSYDAYITLTYVDNQAPDVPSIYSPAYGQVVSSQQPVLSIGHHDPDGDNSSGYGIQVSDHYPVDGNIYNAHPGFVVADGGTINGGGGLLPVLTRGSTYYWHAQTKDASLWGPYSVTMSFRVGVIPTAAVTAPGTDTAAPLYYNSGTDTTPKFKPIWTMTDSDGHAQASAIIRIYDAAGTTLLHTHNYTGPLGTVEVSGFAPANGTKYQISVQATCSLGLQSAESAKKRCQVRWGRASYRADLGAAPLTLSVSSSSTLNSGQVVLEYGSTSGTTPEPTDWKATVAEVTKQRYEWHRVTLMPQVVASPTSPKLNSVTWTYSNNVLIPDDWVLDGQCSIDTGTFVYGTQSLKITCISSADHYAYQDVTVVPDTNYIISGRIKTQGVPGARIQVMDDTNTVVLAEVTATSDTDFIRYATPVFNSGSNAQVRVRCFVNGATGGFAWFDALKLEASQVVTPWTPGFLGSAVVLDAGGMSIDAADGGVFRLRGSGGTADDIIRLGAHGLVGANMATGWTPFALPVGGRPDDTNVTSTALAVVAAGLGGSVLIPIMLTAPMRLSALTIFSPDTANLRTAEWRLYTDDGTDTLREVVNANGTFSFTPTVASVRSSASAVVPVLLSPGIYWLIIRNTSTAQTFAISLGTALLMSSFGLRSNAATAALGSTISGATYTGLTNRTVNCALRGLVYGSAGSY